ncbi:hypothetical protein RclHR1_29630001, partial [Rhizophagus clarus]
MNEVSLKIDDEIDIKKIDVVDSEVAKEDKIDVDDTEKEKIDVDDTDKDKIEVDDTNKEDTDKDDTNKNKIDNGESSPHKGKPITEIEVSPNEKYLVTYSRDDRSFVGWNIENKNNQPKPEPLNIDADNVGNNLNSQQICISDDKKLGYINGEFGIKVFDTMNNQEIKVDLNNHTAVMQCAFNSKGELILQYRIFEENWFFNDIKCVICMYSIQTKNNKLIYNCKRLYLSPTGFELISISKYNKHYLIAHSSIYEFNLITGKDIKIFGVDKYIGVSEVLEYKKSTRISSNEKFICMKIKDKIIIYSIELEIPIVSLDIDNVNQLLMFMKYIILSPLLFSSLFPLLFSLFNNMLSGKYWDVIMKDSKCLSLRPLKNYDQIAKSCLPNDIRVASEYAFVIINGDFWMIDLEKAKSNINSLLKEIINNDDSDEIIDNWYEYSGNYFENKKETFENKKQSYDHLIILLHNNPYMKRINKLIESATSSDKSDKPDEDDGQEFTIKWNYSIYNNNSYHKKVEIKVFKKNNGNSEWDCICTRIDHVKQTLQQYRDDIDSEEEINNNHFVLITEIGLFAYYFNENNNSISLIYFYYIYPLNIESYKKVFLNPTLPLPNYDSFKHCDEWILSIKEHKESLLKYGTELLKFAIKEHKSGLIDDIYKKCINYFKEDLGNNKMFLSIITSTMPLLNEYYPEYISRYSLETTMIVDLPFHIAEYKHINLHLYSFQHYLQMTDITQSIGWLDYRELMRNYETKKYQFINDWYKKTGFPKHYFYIVEKFSKTPPTPTTIFMNPYIKFVNYPKVYNWFFELIYPQPSPFVETINRDIYKTWSGEVIIKSKWNNFGKYYYAIIWIGFIAFLGCFTAAATIPDIDDDVRNKLL